MMHAAEEDHLHQPEEQEQEEDGEADTTKGKEPEVMRISVPSIWMSIPIHRRDGRSLSIFSRLRDGSCHFGGLDNSLGNPGFISHESACDHEANKQQDSDQPKNETVTIHVYLQ